MHFTAAHRAWSILPMVLGVLAVGASVFRPREQAKGVVFLDANGNGVRDAGEAGVPGVRVSNQHEVVLTAADGSWTLPVYGDDTTFFVVKPRGMRTPRTAENIPRFYYQHKPAGSPPLKFGGVTPTGPLPAEIAFPLTAVKEGDAFQALFFGDTQPRDLKEVEYMAHDVLEDLIGTDAAFGTVLGDIVFDDLSVMEPLNAALGTLGIPFHYVIGNHDTNYDSPDDAHSDETFERYYGPNYYSFDYGPVHFIALDNVHWDGGKEHTHYHGEFGEAQLEFVRNDLALTPKDQLVVLLMHIPLADVTDRPALFKLIEDRPHTLSVAAHKHHQEQQFFEADRGWNGKEPHHHIINVTVCGGWWSGAPDEDGIPHAMMADGAPNGCSILHFDGTRYTFEFRPARRPQNYQMEIGAPESIRADAAADTEVTANVFAGSPRSIVEMRAAGGAWTAMERVLRQDPRMARLKRLEKEKPAPPGRALPADLVCPHLWAAKLPKIEAPGEYVIEVRERSYLGETRVGRRLLRVTAQ